MRIALVTEYYYPHLGGVTEHVHNLALELQSQGITHRGDGPHGGARAGIDCTTRRRSAFVRRIGTSRMIYSAGSFARITTGTRLRRGLRALFRREHIDIVHVHGGLNRRSDWWRPMRRDLGFPWSRPSIPGSAARPCAASSAGRSSAGWTVTRR